MTPDITADASIVSPTTSAQASNLSNAVTASSSVVNEMKDMMLLQFKSQELNCEHHKLACEADAARQTELMQTLKENSSSGKMPPLPKLETKKDWA